MTPQELATILSRMYLDALHNETTTMIRLFGIRYADEIRHCGGPVTEIVRLSEVSDSYHAEVSKGMRLARYVSLRTDCDFGI